MAQISIVVAVTRNNAIGKNGDLLYHISDDLKQFKKITMGHPIIMGRKTFESFPNGPLPGRENIVITRQVAYNATGITLVSSLQQACEKVGEKEAMVIGGGEIYRQALPLASKLYLTVIDVERDDADTFFPEINYSDWKIVEESGIMTDERSGVSYRSFVYLAYKR